MPNKKIADKHEPWPPGAIFTVGHSTHAVEHFIAILQAYGIQVLADVRTVPRSRFNPQFNSQELANSLQQEGIAYVAMPGLGGLRHARKDSPNTAWRNASFRGYADYMQTDAFDEALETLVALRERGRVAIMCAEAVPWRCHRSLIADALNVRGVPVIEILSETSRRPHKLTPFVRIDGNRLTYPPEQPSLI